MTKAKLAGLREEPGASLFAELLALDGRADKEDYFDAASGEWDVEGLQDDLRMTKAKLAGLREEPGASLFAELLALDGRADKEDYFDAASGEWDVEGLQNDLRMTKVKLAGLREEPGASLFAELLALDGRADQENYFDAASGKWDDLEGLKDDLRKAKAERAKREELGASLFAELLALDGRADKEDYFDAASGKWDDLEALQDDLRGAKLAGLREELGASLFAELLALDGRADKEDYFDAASGEWDDLEALQDDLRKAKAERAKSAGLREEPGASLFAELLALDGRADKEDYFDAASGTWDVEGLQDDLRLAKAGTGG
ncbi:unnamed protein product [Effrenium voratum]|nr:unnamed protein product [Effrenium voratum]